MNAPRWFAAFVALVGLELIMIAGYSGYLAHTVGRVSLPGTEGLRTAAFFEAGVCAIAGILTLASSYGLYRNREWGRRMCLAIAAIVGAYSLLAIAVEPSRWFDYVMGVALFLLSWVLLWKGASEKSVL